MSNSTFREIELTLKSDDLITTYEFEGVLLGQAVDIDEEEALPQELIRIYQEKTGKFASYMEYSDRNEGIWESKIFVADDLDLAKINRGLTREGYQFGGLHVDNVPSKILEVALYHAIEKLERSKLDKETENT